MAQKFNQQQLNQIIGSYLSALKGKIKVQEAILFGSYATGKEHEFSDIDLFIISEDLPIKKTKAGNGLLLDEIVGNVNPFLEVLGAHPEALNSSINKDFFDEIKARGIAVANLAH